MRHAILGAGGVGGLVGAALAHSGEYVTLVLRQEALASYPAALTLESCFGSFPVPVNRAASIAEPYDVLWVAVKATQLNSALEAVQNAEGLGSIVPLLNGIDHVSMLRSCFGRDRVVPATISVETERVSPGKIIHRSPFARLNVSAAGEGRLGSAIAKLKAFGFECQFMADEATLLWSKLVFLGPFALATTAANMTIGEVTGNPEWRSRLELCISEACAVAVASGATVDPAKVIAAFGTIPHGMRSSMQKDVAAGKTPELDAIAGPILRGGQDRNIDVAATRKLADEVRARARG